jgi:tRNA (guanine10-N2)-methyltransferase
VKLKNPDVCLQLVEYYGLDSNNIPEKPYDLFFGRWVGIKNRLRKCSVNTFSKQVAVLRFCSAFKYS